jgi:hypothetical protein
MKNLQAKTFAPLAVLILLCSSCTAITHVDEFETAPLEKEQCEQEALNVSGDLICYEDIPSEIRTCMDKEFNLNLSKECSFCRCTKCDVEIRDCGLRCWEIVACAILNRCDRGDTASCVAENCANVLERAQAGIDQANALAVCIGGCYDLCLNQ